MKVLVANWFSTRGGEEKHVYDTLTQLSGAPGMRIHVAAPRDCAWSTELDALPGLKRINIAFKTKADALSVLKLARLMRRERYDVVHAHGARAGWLTRLAAVMAGQHNVVWTMHLLILDHVSRQPGWTRGIYAGLERFLNRRTARIIAVSENLRQGLLASDPRLDPSRVVTVSNGIAPLRPAEGYPLKQSLGLAPKDRVGAMVGKLQREKGHDLAIRALYRLPAAERPHLAIIGQGMLRDELQKLAESQGVSQWVHFLGFQKQVPEILAAADFFLMPSRYEGFPIALLEAMALGKPIIAAAVNGIPEALRDGSNGLLIPADDPGALAEALRVLLSDPERARRLGLAAQETYREKFTLERCCESIRDVYARIAA